MKLLVSFLEEVASRPDRRCEYVAGGLLQAGCKNETKLLDHLQSAVVSDLRGIDAGQGFLLYLDARSALKTMLLTEAGTINTIVTRNDRTFIYDTHGGIQEVSPAEPDSWVGFRSIMGLPISIDARGVYNQGVEILNALVETRRLHGINPYADLIGIEALPAIPA